MRKRNGFTIGFSALSIFCAMALVFISACDGSGGKNWRRPRPPTVDAVTSPTNVNPVTLSGKKQKNTSIWINGTETVPLDSTAQWSAQFTLVEGENIISVTAKEFSGKQSGAVSVTIDYDSTPPANPASFTATGEDGQISLAWSNPAATDFDGVTIRSSTVSAPALPTDGAGVYYAAGTSVVDTALTNYIVYYYTAFSNDLLGNYSSGTSLAAFSKGPAGTLDTSFNTVGYASHDGAAGSSAFEFGYAITLDGSGKILVTGYGSNGANDDMVIWRFNPDGSLDTTFDTDGIVSHNDAAGGNSHDYGYAIALDGSGKILVAGESHNGADIDMALWRFNPDGSLDTSFDTDGIVIHDSAAGASLKDVGYAIVLDGSGKILVAGQSHNGANFDMALWRFNSDGSLDTSFDTDGFATHDNAAGGNSHDYGYAIALDGSGKILVAGYSFNGSDIDMALWRFNSDGSLDTSFDTDGFVTHDNAAGGNLDDYGYAMALDGSGKILVAGYSANSANDDLALWRFNSDGSLDTSFDTDGIVSHDNAAGGSSHDHGRAIALDGSGKILVAGYSSNGANDDMILWRFNSDGSLDTTFDTDGIVIHDNAAGGSGADIGYEMALDDFGRIVVTGFSFGANNDMAIWRYNN